MGFENWNINATKVEKSGERVTPEDAAVLTPEDLALIERVLAEAPEVVPKEHVAVPKEDAPTHVVLTDEQRIEQARDGINPHGAENIYGTDGYQSAT